MLPVVQTLVEIPVAAFGGNVHPNEFNRRHIERSLDARKRYKYVSPSVRSVKNGYLIVSPCCSRNIDKDGGIIDVALLEYVPSAGLWNLYRKEHPQARWCLHATYERLPELIAQVNADPARLFWQ